MRAGLAALLAVSGVAEPAPAADLTFPDRGRAAVVDAAHVLPAADAASLNAKVAAWDNATGHQLAIVTVPSLQGDSIADYGYRLGRSWGLGRKGINDGVAFIIAPTEHRVRIEVGRGLEANLTDSETSVILSGTVVPRLKAGDVPGAISAGADAIMANVPADAGDMANAPKSTHGGALGIILMILGGLGLGAVLVAGWRKQREMKRRMEGGSYGPRRSDAPMRAAGYDIGSARRFTAGPSPLPPPPPIGGSGARHEPRRSTTVIAPAIVSTSPSYDVSPSWGSSSSDSGSSPSDSGSSSSGFDSGGGDFGGGGSDSSW